MARIRSDIFVSSLIRSVFAQGGFGAVLWSGNDEAGAIYLVWRKPDGTEQLIAPTSSFLMGEAEYDATPQRVFELKFLKDGAEIAQKMEREKNYDEDLWLVELECAELPESIHLLDLK